MEKAEAQVEYKGDSQVEFKGDSQVAPNKGGRPTKYTPELGDYILSRLSLGESLNEICKDEDIPHRSTIHRWIVDDLDGFYDKYARACDARAEIMFDEILEISDETDKIIRKGAEKKSNAYAQAQRLRVDSRKWYLSKLKPKKYGEKLDLTSDGKPITNNSITIIDGAEPESESPASVSADMAE